MRERGSLEANIDMDSFVCILALSKMDKVTQSLNSGCVVYMFLHSSFPDGSLLSPYDVCQSLKDLSTDSLHFGAGECERYTKLHSA